MQRRLETLLSHINPPNTPSQIRSFPTLSHGQITEQTTTSFDIDAMANFLLGPEWDRNLHSKMLKLASNPIMRKNLINLPKEKQREITDEQVKFLINSGEFQISRMKTDARETLQRFQSLAYIPGAASVKMGVQLILFSGAVMNLGTERHLDVLRKCETLEIPGCFGMTELGHGSAVQKLETTATYDPSTQEFIINTPSQSALKWWLGNAGNNAIMCACFARLILNNEDYGIHVFLVPIRDPITKELLPNIHCGDCGDKIGLSGVDNGFLGFNNVRIPRENLLNRFGDVSENGEYSSPFPSNNRRFAAHMGELITGRVMIVNGTLNMRRLSVLIAIRYAARRRQFDDPNRSGETPILNYRSHQVRLMPILASCYVYEFSKRIILEKYTKLHSSKISDEELAELHALSAGMKAILSWDTQTDIQTCRQTCGGHGYSSYNKFGMLQADNDIMSTFEGDNTVLVQQLGGFLMKEFAKQFQKNQVGAVLSLIGSKIGSAISMVNPAQMLSNPNLTSSRFQIDAFTHRTALILQNCAQSINSQRKKKGFAQAWNDHVPQIVRLARAYVEQFALESYVVAIRKMKDRELRRILKVMRNVFALNIMIENFVDFSEVVSVNHETLHRTFVKMCNRLSAYAVSLVDAFNIPDILVDAPIGLSKGDYMKSILRYAIEKNEGNHANVQGLLEEDGEAE